MSNTNKPTLQDLQKTKGKLLQVARLNAQIEKTEAERQASRDRLNALRAANSTEGRWHDRESLPDPSMGSSAPSRSPTPAVSSNESSVDPFTAKELWRPETCPPKPPRHREDVVRGVRPEDLSDREDDGDDVEGWEESGEARGERQRSEESWTLFVKEDSRSPGEEEGRE